MQLPQSRTPFGFVLFFFKRKLYHSCSNFQSEIILVVKCSFLRNIFPKFFLKELLYIGKNVQRHSLQFPTVHLSALHTPLVQLMSGGINLRIINCKSG